LGDRFSLTRRNQSHASSPEASTSQASTEYCLHFLQHHQQDIK
jgi:hypothetical protein